MLKIFARVPYLTVILMMGVAIFKKIVHKEIPPTVILGVILFSFLFSWGMEKDKE